MGIATKQWVTGTVPAGSSLECNLVMDGGISLFGLSKLQITPSAAGGLSSYQIWDTDGFDTNLLYEASANALSPFYDPVKIDSNGNMTEQGPAWLFLYEDADNSGELHVKIGNQAGVDRTYTVKIWYWDAEAISSFNVVGDVGDEQTITNGNSLVFSGGPGIVTSGMGTDTIALNLDGVVMVADYDVKNNSWVIDEDDMSSDLDTRVPTQQSVKAYVDSNAAASVGTSGTPVANDIARFTDADTIEGLSYTEFKAALDLEVGTDILAQQTIGIADDDLLEVDGSPNSGEWAVFTANGIDGKTHSEARTLLNVADGATANSTDATLLDRSNHTGTQTASTISDFDTEVANNSAVTANTAKVSYLGSASETELNILDGATLTTAELNILDGITATTTEINTLDGFTGSYEDLNYAKNLRTTGVTATEFDYLDGVTSSIQTQLDGKGDMSNLVDDTSPQAGGEVDFNSHSAGCAWNTYSGTSMSIDLRNGNNVKMTAGAGASTVTISNAPSQVCSMLWLMVQDGTGSRDFTLPSATWFVTEPTWTDGTASQKLYLAVVYNGSGYDVVGATGWES